MKKMLVCDIEITIIKRDIKDMFIRVVPPCGEVQVTVPRSASPDAIRMFVILKLPWIKNQRQKQNFNKQPCQTQIQYETGESHYLWGKRYILDVNYSKIYNEVKISGEKLILNLRQKSTSEQKERILKEWYREQLKQKVPEVLEKCENTVGIKCNKCQIRDMKTKWGNCNLEKKVIWLNLQLVKKAPECLDYVITHELVHLLERKHNDIFMEYMDKFLPNWRIAKDILHSQEPDYIDAIIR